MNRDSYFFQQSEWMLRLMPFVGKEKCFALKGGTAINFFIRNMPRLSVDIDLTYLPIEERDISLTNISAALKRISKSIKTAYPTATIKESIRQNRIAKLMVIHPNGFPVVIEPNEIIRGTLFEVQERQVSHKVEEIFELSATLPVCSIEDIYGGKLCAALDRQHPRDLFDVKFLLENEGITAKIRQAFLVYLASHDRPMHELLNPSFKNILENFNEEFVGMTNDKVKYEELEYSREQSLILIKKGLTAKEKEFLLSLKVGEPKWNLIDIPSIENLPSLKWKLINIKKMEYKKHQLLVNKLKGVLEL